MDGPAVSIEISLQEERFRTVVAIEASHVFEVDMLSGVVSI